MRRLKWRCQMLAIPVLAFVILASGAGCAWFGGEEKPQPGDVTLDLGEGVELRLVWVEPLQLLVGKYEVTNKQYRRFKPAHRSGEHQGLSLDGDQQPVVKVSWKDAKAFCDWLTQNHGNAGGKQYVFRLPTEAEWVAFATCGKNTDYPWGNEWPPPMHCNYFGLENPTVGPKVERGDKFQVSAPVRKSGKNAWRIYGTAGNVWEWTSDKEGANSYIMKGGAWSDSAPLFLRTDRRSAYDPAYTYVNLGFRVVATAAEGKADATAGTRK